MTSRDRGKTEISITQSMKNLIKMAHLRIYRVLVFLSEISLKSKRIQECLRIWCFYRQQKVQGPFLSEQISLMVRQIGN